MSSRSRIATFVLATLCAARVLACGPDFPYELLTDRTHTLLALPDGSYYLEIARLVAPTDKLRAIETDTRCWDLESCNARIVETRVEAEQHGLDDAGQEALAAARAAPTAAAAYAAGGALPEAARRYVAGAVAFLGGDDAAARLWFESVLALPAAEGASRALWAHYMLGRIAARAGDVAGAVQAFARVRVAALAGLDDPLGLAVASYGEQARVARTAGDVAGGMRLYAEQAARGSRRGADSLLMEIRRLAAAPAALPALLRDPLVRAAVVATAFSRPFELGADTDEADQPARVSAAALGPLFDALLSIPAAIPGRDRAAAVAYRAGRFALAARFAAGDPAPLSAWVRAKLALRAGDEPAAAAAYAEAARAFPADEVWGRIRDELSYDREFIVPACRVAGEHGVLALARGDYEEALSLLVRAGAQYWKDAAYVAERVLRADELQRYVDTRLSGDVVRSTALTRWDIGSALRALLARRLLREGRDAAALAYFDDPERRDVARVFVAARAATRSWNRIRRAEAWWTVARLARAHGLELLGYEGDPDYAIYGGNFGFEWLYTDDTPAGADAGPAPRRDLEVPAEFASTGEHARLAASVARPLRRFHYRDVAAEAAGRAADLVPARSQAFAAILCGAAGWIMDRDPAGAHALWRRYVEHGAYVPWTENFGRQCQTPDFGRAATRLADDRRQATMATIRQGGPVAGGALAAAVAALWWWRRKSRV